MHLIFGSTPTVPKRRLLRACVAARFAAASRSVGVTISPPPLPNYSCATYPDHHEVARLEDLQQSGQLRAIRPRTAHLLVKNPAALRLPKLSLVVLRMLGGG